MAQPPSRLTQLDGAIAVLLAALAFVPGLADKGVVLGELPPRPVDALAVGLALAQSLPLAVRRRWPGPVFAVVALAWATDQAIGYPSSLATWGLLIALFTAGEHLGRRWAIPATAGYAVLSVLLHRRGSPETAFEFVTFGVVLGACWAAGAWLRGRQRRDDQRRAREAEEAVTEERARIARELHDVVTHHVTAMVVQADAAPFEADPTANLESISDTGRRALGDLRHLLSVLHAPTDTGLAPTVQPLADLVQQIRAAGQPVDLAEDGSPRLLAGGAELAAYRVVQEGLTNAMKHATGQPTRVRIRYGEAETAIEVLTDGPPLPERNPGRGLTGLRERVGVFGGSLTAAARPEGGFRLYARIPAGGAG